MVDAHVGDSQTARKTILIIEDDERNLDLTCQILEGYALLTATDGRAGIAIALEKAPDLILMDLSLPKVDGWRAVRQLRAEEATRRTPIVVLSGHARDTDISRATEAGADGYVTKPVDETALIEVIERLLG